MILLIPFFIDLRYLIDGMPVVDKLDDVQKHNILYILDIYWTGNEIIQISGCNSNERLKVCLMVY